MTAAPIAAALGGGYRSGEWHRCRCPVHQSNGATLALKDGPRGLIVHCHAGCSRDDVLAELRRLGLLRDDGAAADAPDPAEIARRRAAEERNRQKRIAEALDFWRHETLPVAPGTVVERYWLCARPGDCRSRRRSARRAPGCAIPKAASGRRWSRWSSMSSSARSRFTGRGCRRMVRRRPRSAIRACRSARSGGAVRLAPARETCRWSSPRESRPPPAAMLATGWPGWAALSAGGIERAGPAAAAGRRDRHHRRRQRPQWRRRRGGTQSGRRWLAEGRRVRIALPPEPGTDWNDVLRGKDSRIGRRAMPRDGAERVRAGLRGSRRCRLGRTGHGRAAAASPAGAALCRSAVFGEKWGGWIEDAAEAAACPPDYVAAPLLASSRP